MSARPPIVDRATWLEQIAELRKREKAHTREGDAIAAARRRLPMVEVEASAKLVGASGEVTLLDAFEGRSQLFASIQLLQSLTGVAAGRPPQQDGVIRRCRGDLGALPVSRICHRESTLVIDN